MSEVADRLYNEKTMAKIAIEQVAFEEEKLRQALGMTDEQIKALPEGELKCFMKPMDGEHGMFKHYVLGKKCVLVIAENPSFYIEGDSIQAQRKFKII